MKKQLLEHKDEAPQMSEAEARAIQEAFIKEHDLDASGVHDKINAAARLMMEGRHEETIQAYTLIMQEHPEERGSCEGQIGAAYFFLKDYDKAIEYYRAGKDHGADADMMDANIEEAIEAKEKIARGEDPEEETGGISPLALLMLVLVLGAAAYFIL